MPAGKLDKCKQPCAVKVSKLQAQPDPGKLDFGSDFYQLTLNLTTRGGDLRHAQVSGADDVIVTGSVPGLSIREKQNKVRALMTTE